VQVRFEPAGLVVDAEPGERVLDCLDEHALTNPSLPRALPVRCRAGNCGACLVAVRGGGEALAAPSGRERRTLDELEAGADERLGCQLELCVDPARATGAVVLELRGSASTT